jgi:predicted TIM-barrel fold metal-dependent hydrolase
MEAFEKEYAHNPNLFDEDPIEVFKRNVWVHPFHEEDPQGIVRMVGVDRVVFGSDYPHPEGLADPVSYVDQLGGLTHDEIAKVMGGNLADVLKIAA